MHPLRILQVGTSETGGGAASIAAGLAREHRKKGCLVWQAVGRQTSDDESVVLIPDDDRAFYRVAGYRMVQDRLASLASRSPGVGWGVLSRSLRLAAHPRALVDRLRGREDFEFPGTYGLLARLPARPDVVHCHNLHGGYFDLRALPWLSREVPTVLTLHDAWALSGHCAHSFECDRWKTGCGQCPDLTIDPPICRDATATNWDRKRDIYARSRLYIATPCRWLLDKVEQSALAPAVVESRVIPHGIDLSVFKPADKRSVRPALGIPPDADVLLVTTGQRGSAWRDHRTLRDAAGLIASRHRGRELRIIVLGGNAGVLQTMAAVRVVGHEASPMVVARYFQAADVYLHAARADTFPTVVLEALACETAVVATAVGGIPEQITDGVTGILAPPGDARALADAVLALLTDADARCRIARHAANDARERFDATRQAASYLAWYGAIIDGRNLHAVPRAEGASTRRSCESRVAVDRDSARVIHERV